ncbi:MAG TPA: hypothetical protein VJ755_03135 [Gemmatimonadales bacterium]|nr:hypothetical protein [Gemmatimonadales bacterium]
MEIVRVTSACVELQLCVIHDETSEKDGVDYQELHARGPHEAIPEAYRDAGVKPIWLQAEVKSHSVIAIPSHVPHVDIASVLMRHMGWERITALPTQV